MTIKAQLDAARNSGLITAEDLLNILQTQPDRVKLVDATYPANPSLPGIANAVTWDIDDIADPHSQMAHMLPDAELFAQKIGRLGISNDDFVICYDQSGFIMASSRAWWMLRVFGHDNVAVLDGGLTGWIQKNYPVHLKNPSPEPKNFKPHFRSELVLTYEDMARISSEKSSVILDARPRDRFNPDHIPNSMNLPVLNLMNPDRGICTSREFRDQLEQLNIDIDSPIAASCGSGVTACGLALALFREGKKDVPVYDGSWTEWFARKN